jgi:hypothetical protein
MANRWDPDSGIQPQENDEYLDPRTNTLWIYNPNNPGNQKWVQSQQQPPPKETPDTSTAGAFAKPLASVAGQMGAAAIQGQRGDSIEAAGLREQANLHEEQAAKQQANNQRNFQIGNRNEYVEGDKQAAAQGGAENAQRIANRGAVSGAASAALDREVKTPEYDQFRERADRQFKEGEEGETHAYMNRQEGIRERTAAGQWNRYHNENQQQNKNVAQATQAPPAGEQPNVPAETEQETVPETVDHGTPPELPQEPESETPAATPEPETAAPAPKPPPAASEPVTEPQLTPEEKKLASQRAIDALKGLVPDAELNENNPDVQAGIAAYKDNDAWEAFRKEMNTRYAGNIKGGATPVGAWKNPAGTGFQYDEAGNRGAGKGFTPQQKALQQKLFGTDPNQVDPTTGETTAASDTAGTHGGDRRIKTVTEIISDLRLKKNKTSTQKLVPLLYKRF